MNDAIDPLYDQIDNLTSKLSIAEVALQFYASKMHMRYSDQMILERGLMARLALKNIRGEE